MKKVPRNTKYIIGTGPAPQDGESLEAQGISIDDECIIFKFGSYTKAFTKFFWQVNERLSENKPLDIWLWDRTSDTLHLTGEQEIQIRKDFATAKRLRHLLRYRKPVDPRQEAFLEEPDILENPDDSLDE